MIYCHRFSYSRARWLLIFLVEFADSFVTVGNSATNTPLKNSQTLPQTEPQGDESINPEHPPKPAEPYWIVPPGFRENTFWVDRSKEMRELHQRLHDRKRRNDGTACVLVHGQAGVGKSHLARQYVNKHREKFFAGGIFWIPSKIKEEREKLFWDIHQKVVARESPELCTNSDKPFRESVKAWFEARHDWLIVFDGVVVDKDADVTELAGFVPDSKNSSIIYISLSKSLESRRRLRQPFPIRVAPLPEEHARNLLLKQLEHERKRKPTEAEKKAAMELVRKIGCLPLAIDAISHRIAETSEPLTKFNIKSYSADPKLKGTYETILKDLQLSHPHLEAWNLINILCFFGQHIPVEMVHLGLRGLPTEVKIKSSEVDGEEPNLNTTFSTLMKYALIERNPPEDKSSATSSYDSLVDPIDMLKLHSVVQKFCCDSLDASKLLPEWLTHAVELFAYSYHKADEKIKQKPEPGRISDYRDYLVHGHHLLDHTRFYEKRSQNLEVVRMQLSPVLDLITQEIRSREPSSSQESVNRAIFQISIFDRTNSSSDSTTSLPEQLRDYSSRPTILPPHYNQFGMDGQQQLDSPRSVSTASPVERRGYNHGELVQMPEAPDLGYESEIETRREALPMQNSLSDHTVRPPPRPPSPEWLIVNRKPKKPPRKDLGEFRKLHPWPATAQVKSNTTTAVGSVGQIQKSREALRPRNSDVSVLLRDIKQHSPPQKNSVLNFWQRKTPPKRPSQPTIHHHQHPRHDFNLHVSGSPMPVYDDSMERFGSRESFRTGQSSQRPSPRMSDLRSDSGFSIPDNRYRDSSTSSVMEDVPNYKIRPSPEGSRMMIDNRHPYSNNNANNQSNIPHISTPPYDLTRPRNTTNENFEPIYPSSQDGRNTAPLPIVQNVSVSRPSHFNFELQNLQNSPPYPDHPIVPPPYNQQYHHQNVTTRPSQSPYQQPPRNISSPPNFSSSVAFNQLGGYSSQPMSRDTSLTSAGYRSTAETEPVNTSHTRYPSSPPPAAMNIFASSPRDREMDGRPLRKSPKTSLFEQPQAQQQQQHNFSHDTSGLGLWASSPQSSTPPRASPSHGPGFVVPLDSSGGLGIVTFHSGRVQFGDQEPVLIEEARRRANRLEKERERERERERSKPKYDNNHNNNGKIEREEGEDMRRGRRRHDERGVMRRGDILPRTNTTNPYPTRNLIPTGTDLDALSGMVVDN